MSACWHLPVMAAGFQAPPRPRLLRRLAAAAKHLLSLICAEVRS
jgi:hypothetical protein